MLDQFSLEGKVAIVTGASRGIGRALAVALARAGADITGVARSDMSETAEVVHEKGRKFLAINADLSSTEPIEDIVNATVSEFGKLDILVNNAGMIRRQKAVEFEEDNWDTVIDVNLKTPFFLARAAARRFLEQKSRGKIINIASMLSFQGGVFVSSYTASKSALAGVTKALCNEWAEHGINVNAIAPGYIATENTRPLREDEGRNKAIVERIPAGRWGKPEDMNGAAVFLASPAGDYMHGHILCVDGGWLAR